jgi:phosphatidylserine decarboxylase
VSFAREGLVFIGIALAITAGVFALALGRRSWPLWLAAFVCTLLALWVAYFFRDPERRGERGERLVLSPADGRVVMISQVDEPTFMRATSTRISIFMNVFNVHVNRYPVSGTVTHVSRNQGKFFNAALEKASLENEQTSVGIETGGQRVLTRQIAGLIARRIANYAQLGSHAVQGERMGIIRFGSRVDVFVPTESTVKVKVGDLPVAGVTVLAELPR